MKQRSWDRFSIPAAGWSRRLGVCFNVIVRAMKQPQNRSQHAAKPAYEVTSASTDIPLKASLAPVKLPATSAACRMSRDGDRDEIHTAHAAVRRSEGDPARARREDLCPGMDPPASLDPTRSIFDHLQRGLAVSVPQSEKQRAGVLDVALSS